MKIRNFSLAMVIIAIFTVAFAACPTPDPPPSVNATVTFGALSDATPPFPAIELNFSPNVALPAGVTYSITNNRNSKVYNNTGTVPASDFVNVNDTVVFIQTFYLYDVEIKSAGSKRTVTANVGTFMGDTDFSSATSDLSSVTLKHP